MFRKSLPSKSHAKEVEKARKWQKGFTLIEMLAVVIILVIVAALGFVVVNNQIEKSRVNTDMANVRTVADAVQRYLLEHDYPASGDLTVTNLVEGGFLAAAPKDPWDPKNLGNYEIKRDKPSSGDITVSGIKATPIILKGAIPTSNSGGNSN